MVQVELTPVELYIDAVAASSDIFVMHRLVQISDEVNNKLGCLGTEPWRQHRVQRLLGVVGEGTDDAAGLLAVALEVNIAIVRGVVMSVDEVECLGEPTPFGVAD